MTAFVADRFCQQHDPGPGHPECPARFEAALRAVEKYRAQLAELAPVEVTHEDLLTVHTAAYLERARMEIERGEDQLSTGDTMVCPESWDAARMAVGSVFAGVDAVLEGRARNAFCLVRPPGHHATPDRGMGFCILNNIALAARRAQRRYGLERVLIVDWDVHHGNGTQDTFYEDGSVFFFSTHQWPLYPGTGRAAETGAGAGKGTTLNCPLPAGSGREGIFAAFREKLLPAAELFRPELVLLSAGFDSREDDPLGDFRLTDGDFVELTAMMKDFAARQCKGRLVSMLEGGYNLHGLASAVGAHVGALLASEES